MCAKMLCEAKAAVHKLKPLCLPCRARTYLSCPPHNPLAVPNLPVHASQLRGFRTVWAQLLVRVSCGRVKNKVVQVVKSEVLQVPCPQQHSATALHACTILLPDHVCPHDPDAAPPASAITLRRCCAAVSRWPAP